MIEFLKSIPWSSVASIIFGAAISALVSYLLQRNSFAEAKRQKESDRYETRRAHAHSLFFKMIRIHSTIVLLGNAVTECIEKAKSSGFKGTLWQSVLPMGNLPTRVKFSSDEMALLLSLDINLFNDVGPYDDIHNSLLDLFDLYRTRRDTLIERFGAKMSGSMGTTALTKDEGDWVAPRAYELNNLVEIMIQRTGHDSEESKGLLQRTHALFVKEFKLNPKLEFKKPN
jgi:hypothetical protein